MSDTIEKIKKLKSEKDAVILAHYYVDDAVQEIADYVGDSFYLSKVATQVKEQTILFCGVSFMGESAKILNPKKKVIIPDILADCPMAHMVDTDKIARVKEEYDDVAVVCYINSTAEIKAYSDVCVTSSNALKIVKKLPNKNIFFIPDENLGRYVAKQVLDKNFIFNDGYCHVHTGISTDSVKKSKEIHKDAKVLAHPECPLDVLELADYVGSTSEIIDYATKSKEEKFIIGTEIGVLYELKKNNPDKIFYSAGAAQMCPNMKRITIEKVIKALEAGVENVSLEEEIRLKAEKPLLKMLELAK